MAPASPLSDFPRPSVAVDLAVLTVVDDALCVVLRPTADSDAGSDVGLPGMFIRERRTVTQTVAAVMQTKLGLPPFESDDGLPAIHLLEVFDQPARDTRGWTLSIGCSLTLVPELVPRVVGEMAPVAYDGSVSQPLSVDHETLVRLAVTRIRARYEAGPDPDGLLRPPFTLTALRRLHEAVLGDELAKDTFNRRMKDRLAGLVEEETEQPLLAGGSVGRPAQMFTYSAAAATPPSPAPTSLPRAGSPRRRRT